MNQNDIHKFNFLKNLLQLQFKLQNHPLQIKYSMWKNIIFLIIYLLERIASQDFQVSLTFPSQVDNNHTNIMAVGKDIWNNFLISLENSQARRYNPSLTSYINFTLKEPAVRIYGQQDVILNLSLTRSRSNIIHTLANIGNTSIIRTYDANNFNLLQTYIINETVKDFCSFGSNSTGTPRTYFFIFCPNSCKIAYNSTIINLPNAYYNNLQNIYTSIYCNALDLPASLNNFSLNVRSYLSQSDKGIYHVSYTVLFLYNSTSNQYYYASTTLDYFSLIAMMPVQGSYLMYYLSVVMVQQHSTGNWYAYNNLTASFIPITGLPTSLVNVGVFMKYSKLYYVHQTGLSQINITNTSVSLIATTVILPNETYRLIFGSVLNIFYIWKQPYYYLAGACIGQNISSGTTCTSFNCTDANCQFCPIGANTCGFCNQNYYLLSNFTCLPLPIQPTNNSNSTSIVNPTMASILNLQTLLDNLIKTLINLLNKFATLTKTIISVPGARRVVSPLFYYFGIFDDIYFYQFQDRVYGQTMNTVFKQLNQIQAAKWGVISYQKVLSFLQFNSTVFDDAVGYQNTYLTYNFTSVNHTYLGSQGFLSNCQNFVFVGVPMIIGGFIAGHILFNIFFSYLISKIFRKCDFWLFIFLLFMDGNVQQFSFYLSRDITNVFSFQFHQKFIKMTVIYFAFITLLYSVSMFFFSSFLYKKLSYYFTDNNKNSVFGSFLLVIQYGFKNMLMGVLQTQIRVFQFTTALKFLLIIQILFLLVFVLTIKAKIYKIVLKFWLIILLNFIKIMLIFTFLLDVSIIMSPLIEVVQQFILFIQIFLYFLSVGFEVVSQISQFVKFMINHYKGKDKQKNIYKMNQKKKRKPQIQIQNRKVNSQQYPSPKKNKQMSRVKGKLKKKTTFVINKNSQLIISAYKNKFILNFINGSNKPKEKRSQLKRIKQK